MVSTGVAKYLSLRYLVTDASVGGFELGPLDPGSCYPKPGQGDAKALKCGCNSVIYRLVNLVLFFCTLNGRDIPPPSLYSACAACQNVSMGTWTGWSENCDSVYVTQ